MSRQNNMTGKAEKDFNVTVKKALPGDVDRLIQLGKRCFYEAFSDVTAPEDMAAYLAATFQETEIESQVRDDRSH